MPSATRFSFTARTGSDTGTSWATVWWAKELPKSSVRQSPRTSSEAGAAAVASEDGRKAGARRSAARLLCAAALLHLVLAVTVYGLGRYALLPGTFDENGVGVAFASDGVRYRADAAVLSDALRRGEIRSWAGADRPFHVKLYAVCFA